MNNENNPKCLLVFYYPGLDPTPIVKKNEQISPPPVYFSIEDIKEISFDSVYNRIKEINEISHNYLIVFIPMNFWIQERIANKDSILVVHPELDKRQEYLERLKSEGVSDSVLKDIDIHWNSRALEIKKSLFKKRILGVDESFINVFSG